MIGLHISQDTMKWIGGLISRYKAFEDAEEINKRNPNYLELFTSAMCAGWSSFKLDNL